MLKTAWNPFEADFGSLKRETQQCSDDVRNEIKLALHEAANQEQQLQQYERELARVDRSIAGIFRQRADNELSNAQDWRMRVDEREARKYFHRAT